MCVSDVKSPVILRAKSVMETNKSLHKIYMMLYLAKMLCLYRFNHIYMTYETDAHTFVLLYLIDVHCFYTRLMIFFNHLT